MLYANKRSLHHVNPVSQVGSLIADGSDLITVYNFIRIILSFSEPEANSGSRLMSTINQVHDNMLELVKHGVVNPEQIIHSAPVTHLPPVSKKQQAPAPDSNMRSQRDEDRVRTKPPTHTDSATETMQDVRLKESSLQTAAHGVIDSHQAPADITLHVDVSSTVSRSSHSTHLSLNFDAQQDMEANESDNEGGWVSPFTPRTQATYSMTSDDDEQFSPPIYMSKQRPSGAEIMSKTVTLEGGKRWHSIAHCYETG